MREEVELVLLYIYYTNLVKIWSNESIDITKEMKATAIKLLIYIVHLQTISDQFDSDQFEINFMMIVQVLKKEFEF